MTYGGVSTNAKRNNRRDPCYQLQPSPRIHLHGSHELRILGGNNRVVRSPKNMSVFDWTVSMNPAFNVGLKESRERSR